MLWALVIFLVGCLVVAVVVYVLKLILIDVLTLPDPIVRIALLIIGLIGLVLVLILALAVFRGAVVF
jgi:hypothetical protein